MGWISRRVVCSAAVVASLCCSSGCSDGAGLATLPSLDAALVDRESGDAAATGPDALVQDGSVDSSPGAPESGTEGGSQNGTDGAAGTDGTTDIDGVADTDGTLTDGTADAAGPREGGATACSMTCVHGTCLASSGCACDIGWAGPMCDASAPTLVPATPVAASVTRGQWVYFSYRGLASGLSATLSEDSTTGLVWAYLAAGRTPSQASNLSADENAQSASHSVSYTYASPGTQTWYVGAYGQPAIGSATQAVAFHVQITVIP